MDYSATVPPHELDSFINFQDEPFISDHALQDGGFAELSEALAASQTTPAIQDDNWMLESPFQDLSNSSTAVSSPFTPGTPISRPKLRSRFSRDVIRTLKDWLAVHQQHPYPNEDEMGVLQAQTCLNKAQLTNWFANARRRGKVPSIRPASPQVQNITTNPMDVIPRPGTPAFRRGSRYTDPMQRWVDSPPEHEPATARDIARAMASSSEKTRHENGTNQGDYTYNDPWRSTYARSSARSSASSAATSQSSGDFSTHHSSGSQSSLKIRRAPRIKRVNRRRHVAKTPVVHSVMPYQCTFCTEVFKTKYDWQRHEKSLHLPLEQWICALHGSYAPKKETAELCCVFCGEVAPDDAHIEAHHYSACQERSLEERIFHRKDHLVQHLRLVHGAKFAEWSMVHWMIPMPNIRSRCGFCGTEMSTWEERTDHLADHFKAGTTMANWHGDWGFDDAIVNMVDRAVPPYFIDFERTTLIPMKASDPSWGSPPSAYELLKVEIEFFVQNYFDKHGQLPTKDAMQREACRIIFAAEATVDTQPSLAKTIHAFSWLRDLIMSSPELTRQARFGPIRTSSESRHAPLKINGKDHLFEQCPLEAQLHAFVTGKQLLETTIDDSQIQNEACQIVRVTEDESSTPSDIFANWIVKCICSGMDWLSNFKQRVGVTNASAVISSAAETGSKPDWDIQLPQASVPSSSTSAKHSQNHSTEVTDPIQQPGAFPEEAAALFPPTNQYDMYGRLRTLLPDDTNFFRIFDSDMRRWAAATLSPKNPNCHVPSDEEIQHQARWIMYDGDDPWNQTPADYTEYLWRFKREVGISNDFDVIDPAKLTKHPPTGGGGD